MKVLLEVVLLPLRCGSGLICARLLGLSSTWLTIFFLASLSFVTTPPPVVLIRVALPLRWVNLPLAVVEARICPRLRCVSKHPRQCYSHLADAVKLSHGVWRIFTSSGSDACIHAPRVVAAGLAP